MKLLVTGGAGFIGSNFIRYILSRYPNYKIINLDKLTYAGNLDNLSDSEKNKNYTFIKSDITDQKLVENILREKPDAILNFAAETHVDRSIYNPEDFVKTNIVGTGVLMDAAIKYETPKFIQISTDEVYGSLGKKGTFTEESNLAPNSPYSASKAAADLLCRSYFKTFDFPVIITRSCNNFGPYQFPEKLLPLFISNALSDNELPLYGDGLNIRDWIYVLDNCRAVDIVLHKGKKGEIYNISSNNEMTNLEMTKLILKKLKKPESLIKFVKDRPGHDRRYALDASKLRGDLGWKPKYSFEEGINKTVDWYLGNKAWWEKVKSGEYLNYYRKQYHNR
ncbi:MAG TPA: dTDP-glucose 4,6-dehydratase [candidate division Zixibacteria bacterium]